MKVLDSQEKVLYESRPKLASTIGWKRPLVAVVATLVLLPLGIIFSGTSPVALSLLGLWAVSLAATMLPSVMRQHSKYFALTDQRILWGAGVVKKEFYSISIKRMTGLEDINTGRVTGVTMSIPIGGRLFGYGSIQFQTSTAPKSIIWNGVKHPYEARRFIEGSINRVQEAQGQEIIYKAEITRTLAKIATEQKLGFLPQQAPYQMTSSTQVGGQALPSQVSQQMTLQCIKCELSYPPGTKFCSECGGPLQPAQPRGVPLEA